MSRKPNYDYRDPDFGFFDDVIELASYNYDAWIKRNPTHQTDGTIKYDYQKVTIRGSLQAFKRQFEYSTSGESGVVLRDGKFYGKHTLNLGEGDVIRKGSNYYRVSNEADYDYAGVKNWDIIRLGIAEIREYPFIETFEEGFGDE